jgi:hypothetical protein
MRLMVLILMFVLRTWIFMFVLDIYVCDVYVVSFVFFGWNRKNK